MRCLWLARTLPFPWTAGDRIYSAKLAAALAAAGAEITFAGFPVTVPPAPIPGIAWYPVAGGPRAKLSGLASVLPLVAARHATPAYRATVAALARSDAWDVVVVDHYGMGWVIDHRGMFAPSRPVFVFVTHDHEESVTGLQWRDGSAPLPVRAYLLQNHLKTRRLERRTARASDVVTAITPSDAALFEATARPSRMVVLLPGHDGPRLATRKIEANLPRAVLVFGSYRWSAKQANLRAFLDRADTTLAKAGIALTIIGDMPEEFRQSLAGRHRGVSIVGYVADPAPYLASARLAVVAEPVGGGFKMKLLDYVFNRVPVAALDACATGLPAAVCRHMVLRPDIDALLAAIVSVIDDMPQLDAMQRGAFAAAEHVFDWAERGRALRTAIMAVRDRPADVAGIRS